MPFTSSSKVAAYYASLHRPHSPSPSDGIVPIVLPLGTYGLFHFVRHHANISHEKALHLLQLRDRLHSNH
jgi:hypothetical protein